MLQIISGKFFDSDDRFHNDKKAILYSNAAFRGKTQMGHLYIESVQAYGNISSYIVSFDSQIQKTPSNFQLVDVGGEEVIRQFKNIISFYLCSIFDEEKGVVERVCRKGDGTRGIKLPSDFAYDVVAYKKFIEPADIESCNLFIKHLVGLPRKDYINILNCIVAYNSSIKLLADDISLAYSLLVYCLESLTQSYDNFITTWNDVDESKRDKLEEIFKEISPEKAEQIKEILYTDANLKLAKRFNSFVVEYTSDEFFEGVVGKKRISKSEYEVALKNAYNIRSKYAHMLKPLMKELSMAELTKDSDIFEFQKEVFFTYSGLLRATREVIINFTNSLKEVEKEEYDWHNELPGMFSVEMPPYYWIGRGNDVKGESASERFEGLLQCIVYYNQMVPRMDEVVCTYLNHLEEMKKENKKAAFAVCVLYVETIQNVEEKTKELYSLKFEKYIKLFKECNIYAITICTLSPEISEKCRWNIEDIEQVLEKYNQRKYKKNSIKLPKEIQAILYLTLAQMFSENEEKQDVWWDKAYDILNNNREIQKQLKEYKDSKMDYNIFEIWKWIYENYK